MVSAMERHTKSDENTGSGAVIWLAQVGGNQAGLPRGEGISSKALKKSKQSMDVVFIILCFKRASESMLPFP